MYYAVFYICILFLSDTTSLKEIFIIYKFQFHKVIYFSDLDIIFLIQNFLSQGVFIRESNGLERKAILYIMVSIFRHTSRHTSPQSLKCVFTTLMSYT